MTIIIILIILFLASAFFSASESALISIGKIRLRNLVAKEVKHAKTVYNLVTKKLDKFISAILIGNNIVNIAISSIVTITFVNFFGAKWGPAISIFCVSLFVLIFCEITPKIFAIQHSEKFSLFVAPFVAVFIKIFEPFIFIFTTISNAIIRLFGGAPVKRSPLINEEELRTMIEIGKEEGILTDEERGLLHRIFEFGDTTVSIVMVPRDKIVAVDIKVSPEELLDCFIEQGHARILVYEQNLDNVLGIVYAHDLLYVWKNKELIVLPDLIHPAYFVEESKRINELLREFQAQKIQIAVIRSKEGKVKGLVTLEDLIEEIVGEIDEERSF